MTLETQTIKSAEVIPSPLSAPGCDLADYLGQGVGTLEEVAGLARETANTLDTPLTAQTTTEMAATIMMAGYPDSQRERLAIKIKENTRRTIDGALAGAYIVQNCADCPVAPDCDLLEALRSQAEDGLMAKAENETLDIAVKARKLAADIKPPFTRYIAAQERIDSDRRSPHAISDIARLNDNARGGISRLLMDPSNKPYRNEAIIALKTLLKQDSRAGSLLQRADESDAFSAFNGIAAESFVSEAIAGSDLVTEQIPATRSQDVLEGTDFFVGFNDESGGHHSVRVDAKSSGKFNALIRKGKITKLAIDGGDGLFGIKTVQVQDRNGSIRHEPVLVICPGSKRAWTITGYNNKPLPETGCVNLQQTPTPDFTKLIDSALIAFTQQSHWPDN